jgi:hypothetical protein
MTKRQKMITAGAIVVAVAAAGVTGCGSSGDDAGASSTTASGSDLPQGSDHVTLDPAEFTTDIDNPYWPMAPGSKWVSREQEDGAKLDVEVTVTDRTKVIDGIEARAVRDVVSENGVPAEVTTDYYAQDSEGNIWYLGEDTAEYKNGKPVSTEGSFEAGVDGAEGGVIVPADPVTGLSYREEYYPGQAEDAATVLSVDEQAAVPAGHYDNAVMTSNVNPLEPKAQEYKFYAEGVGPVLTLGTSPAVGTEELVSFKRG